VDELGPLVAGLAVIEVQPLPPRDLLLILEPAAPPPPVLRLRLSADPEAPRLHLQVGRVRSAAGPAGPFFRALAAELEGATLRRIEQVRGDRIALLEFTGTPSGRRRALAAELVGRHANLVLLGPEDEVLQVLVPAPGRAGRAARLEPGRPWSPPGGSAAPPTGDSPPLTEALADPGGDPPGPLAEKVPLSWRVERTLGVAAAEARRARLAKLLLERAKRRRRRAAALVKGLEERARASDRSERVRWDGELLKANLGRLKRGLQEVELEDWFVEGSPPRRVPLDPRRSPQENVERIFARYKKLERARGHVEEEMARARERLAALDALVEAAAADPAHPEALEAEAVAAGLLDPRQEADPRKRPTPPARLPYRVFRVHGGAEVRVGRSAADNDLLTFRHSRGNDLWLHTADRPGSHVILRTPRGREPDPEALIDAALLAVHFSPARAGGAVPVHLARRKEVHKPRGAKPGLVTLSGGRILTVRAQQERLEALLRTARDRPPPTE